MRLLLLELWNSNAKKISDAIQFNSYNFEFVRSNPGVRGDLFRRPLSQVRVTDFLGGVAHADVIPSSGLDAGPLQDISQLQEESAPVPATSSGQIAHERSDDTDSTVESSRKWEEPRTEKTLLPLIESQSVRAWASVGIIGSLVAWAWS